MGAEAPIGALFANNYFLLFGKKYGKKGGAGTCVPSTGGRGRKREEGGGRWVSTGNRVGLSAGVTIYKNINIIYIYYIMANRSGQSAFQRSPRFTQEFKDKIMSYGPIWFHATRTSLFPSFKTFGTKLYAGGQLREKGLVPLTGEALGSFGSGPNQTRISGYTDPTDLKKSMGTYTQYGREFSMDKIVEDYFSLMDELEKMTQGMAHNLPRKFMTFLTILGRVSYFATGPTFWKNTTKKLSESELALIEYYFGKTDMILNKIKELIKELFKDHKNELTYQDWIEKVGLQEFMGSFASNQSIMTLEELLKSINDMSLAKNKDPMANMWMKNMIRDIIRLKINNPDVIKNNKKIIMDTLNKQEVPLKKKKLALYNLIHKPPPIRYTDEDQKVIKESKPIIFGFNDPRLLSQMTNIRGKKVPPRGGGERLIPGPIDLRKHLKFVITTCQDVNYVTDLLKEYKLNDVDVLCDIKLSCKEFYE